MRYERKKIEEKGDCNKERWEGTISDKSFSILLFSLFHQITLFFLPFFLSLLLHFFCLIVLFLFQSMLLFSFILPLSFLLCPINLSVLPQFIFYLTDFSSFQPLLFLPFTILFHVNPIIFHLPTDILFCFIVSISHHSITQPAST